MNQFWTYSVYSVELLCRVNHKDGEKLPTQAAVFKKLPGFLGLNPYRQNPFTFHIFPFLLKVARPIQLLQGCNERETKFIRTQIYKNCHILEYKQLVICYAQG